MQVRVVNGRVELRKDNGILVRVVGYSNAIHAEFHPTKFLLLILSETGKVELRTLEGNVIKEIATSGIKHAFFQNEKVIMTNARGDSKEISLTE